MSASAPGASRSLASRSRIWWMTGPASGAEPDVTPICQSVKSSLGAEQVCLLPLPVVAVVVGEQREADRHRVAAIVAKP